MFKRILEEKLTSNAVYGLAKLIKSAYPEAEFNEFDNSIELYGKTYYIDDCKDITKFLEKVNNHLKIKL